VKLQGKSGDYFQELQPIANGHESNDSKLRVLCDLKSFS
jgi:hypothetical protein